MSDEMEIMREFRKLWKKYIYDRPEIDEVYKTFKKELEPAVKLEVLRQIKIMQGMGIMFQPVERFEEYTRTLQVAPQHCEGMQELINNKIIEVTGGDSKRVYGLYVGVRTLVGGNRIYGPIKQCPKCPDGKNCIGDKK